MSVLCVGMMINQYLLIKLLGEGGMGEVWQAEDVSTREIYALKFPSLNVLAHPRAHVRFLREGLIHFGLQHEYCLKCVGVGAFEHQPYLVLEYCDGTILRSFLRNNRPAVTLDIHERFVIAFQLTSFLRYLHGQGLIHRDMKPANVFVTKINGELAIKVFDFGLVKAVGTTTPVCGSVTLSGAVVGSYAYMSPEQAIDSSCVTAATDLFSLGVILYELFTGNRHYLDSEGKRLEMKEIPPMLLSGRYPLANTGNRTLDFVINGLRAFQPTARMDVDAVLRYLQEAQVESRLLSQAIASMFDGA